jgi:hypothetical protein
MNRSQKDKSEQRDYRSYLLRLWRVQVKAQTIWRASLECPHTGERLAFADLEALWRYLRAETEEDETLSGQELMATPAGPEGDGGWHTSRRPPRRRKEVEQPDL